MTRSRTVAAMCESRSISRGRLVWFDALERPVFIDPHGVGGAAQARPFRMGTGADFLSARRAMVALSSKLLQNR